MYATYWTCQDFFSACGELLKFYFLGGQKSFMGCGLLGKRGSLPGWHYALYFGFCQLGVFWNIVAIIKSFSTFSVNKV